MDMSKQKELISSEDIFIQEEVEVSKEEKKIKIYYALQDQRYKKKKCWFHK